MHVKFWRIICNVECIEFLLIMFDDILEHILCQYIRLLNIQTARYTQVIYSDYDEFTQNLYDCKII